MRINAYVFARAGSKGIPHKNKQLINGLPLFAHSIKAAQALPDIIAGVYVSTDDIEIMHQAFNMGAYIIPRPAHLASNTSNELLSWQHALDLSHPCDTFISLPPTSPLRSLPDVTQTIQALSGSDVAVTVTESRCNAYHKAVTLNGSRITKLFPEASSLRQDCPIVYDIVGSVYASSPAYIRNTHSLFSGAVAGVIVPHERAIDIDTPLDLGIARYLASL